MNYCMAGKTRRVMFGLQCTVCEWSALADEHQSTEEVSNRSIDHHLETGHLPIERVELYTRPITVR